MDNVNLILGPIVLAVVANVSLSSIPSYLVSCDTEH